MTIAIIQFPGTNRDNDIIGAVEKIFGKTPNLLWHMEDEIPYSNLIVIPGGFSYGDYLRPGAIAACSPIIKAIRAHARKGTPILGICNGFQILTESKLLPGALMRNAGLNFVCREIKLKVENTSSIFSSAYSANQIIRCPVAHHDGNYFANPQTLKCLEDNGQVIFRYAENSNPNGSVNDIAGIVNEKGNVSGIMPHPENMIESFHGCDDGRGIFESVLNT